MSRMQDAQEVTENAKNQRAALIGRTPIVRMVPIVLVAVFTLLTVQLGASHSAPASADAHLATASIAD